MSEVGRKTEPTSTFRSALPLKRTSLISRQQRLQARSPSLAPISPERQNSCAEDRATGKCRQGASMRPASKGQAVRAKRRWQPLYGPKPERPLHCIGLSRNEIVLFSVMVLTAWSAPLMTTRSRSSRPKRLWSEVALRDLITRASSTANPALSTNRKKFRQRPRSDACFHRYILGRIMQVYKSSSSG